MKRIETRTRAIWLLPLLLMFSRESGASEERAEAADASSPAQSERPAFRPGEELVYEIRALGMKAGRARIQVGTWAERDGVRSWPVVVNARTDALFDSIYSVRDKFISWWDPETGRVLGSDFWANERGKRHRSRSQLDHEAGQAEVFRSKEWSGERSTKTYEIPAGSYDIAGAIFALRQRPLTPGTVEEIDVFTGKKVFRMRCIVEGAETVKVGAGSFRAITARLQLGFDGNFASKRDVRIWFSADDRKIPLRMEADLVLGSVVASLASARGAG